MGYRLEKGAQPLWRYGEMGLTLLEVVIALTLLSMMSIIAVEAFRLGSRAWDKQQREVETEQRIRVVYEVLAQEVASVKPVTTIVDGKQVVAFQGREDMLFFYSLPDAYRAFPYSGMIRSLSYFVERGQGLVVQENYPLVEGEVSLSPGGKVRIVDPQVTRIRFRYLRPREDDENEMYWVKVWDPLELTGINRRPVMVRSRSQQRSQTLRPRKISRLPLAVEVTLAIAEKRKEQELTFLLPIHIGRRL